MDMRSKHAQSPSESIMPSLTLFEICEYLRRHKGEKVSKGDLAKACRMAPRTLSYSLRGMENLQNSLKEEGKKAPWGEIVFDYHHVTLLRDEACDFSLADVQMLVDGVYAGRSTSQSRKAALLEKMKFLLPDEEKILLHNEDVYDFQSVYEIEKGEWFDNIVRLRETIEKKKVIQISYGRICADKTIKEESAYTVLPFQIVFLDERYFLFARLSDRSVCAFRVDKILKIVPLERRPEEFKGVTGSAYKRNDEFSFGVVGQTYSPFGKTEQIYLWVCESEIERVFDAFGTRGTRVSTNRRNGDRVEVTVAANSADMIRFLCANADVAEVIEPQSIRYAMLRISKNLYQKYMATEQDRVEEAYHAALTAHNGGRLQTSDVMLSDRFEKEGRQDKVTELIVDQLDALILRRMAGYRNLYSLGFEGIEEVDLAVLAHYPELRRLSVDAGGFSPKVELIKVINTDFLQKCPQLESVTLFKTDFADVDALRGLKSLFSLYLNGCKLESLDFLADLPALIDLHLHNCTVKDVSALYRHPSLRILGVDQAFMDVFGEDVRANATHLRIKIAARRLAATTKATKRILSANDENHSMRRK